MSGEERRERDRNGNEMEGFPHPLVVWLNLPFTTVSLSVPHIPFTIRSENEEG